MASRIGKTTILLDSKPAIIGYGSVVGKKEREGPLGNEFDCFDVDAYFGEKTFEKAESRMQKIAVESAFKKAAITERDCDMIFAGDLLNQCIGSTFGLKEKDIPYIGIYGACSTMALGISLASLFVDTGIANIAAAVTSSHFCSAERQYRFPLEYGAFRTPTSQRTVTGAGATVISKAEDKPFISSVTLGKIVDKGITDANNMGAAMAPSAADTLKNFLFDTNTTPEDYDIIFTGDLGYVGTKLFYELLLNDDIDVRCRHSDCGLLIYDRNRREFNSGGSGCGCSGSILNSYIMHCFESGKFGNILFMSTGALLSPTSALQGESIPGVTHLLNIRNPRQ